MRSSTVHDWQRLILAVSILILLAFGSMSQEQMPLNPPGYFSDDYYKVTGGPDLQVSMERSTVYQGDETALILTILNRGNISSFKVNDMRLRIDRRRSKLHSVS